MTAFVRSISFGESSSTSVVVPIPDGVVAGDVLWAHQSSTTALGDLFASGWEPVVQVIDTIFGALKVKLWKRTATSSEQRFYAFSQNEGANGTVIMLAVADAVTSLPVQIATLADAGGTTGQVTTPNVPPAAATHLEIRFAAANDEVPGVFTGVPDGYQPRGTAQSEFVTAAAASRLITSSTPSGAKAFPTSGTGFIGIGVTISIPSGAAEPEIPPPPPFTPGRGSALYQYVFRTLLGRDYLGHLDLSQVAFESRVSSPGSFSGQVPITNERIGRQVDAIIAANPAELGRGPGVICCEVIRAGDYWGEYWITGATIGQQRRKTPTLVLRGVSLDGYFMSVLLRSTLTYTGLDQVEIARRLLTHMQAQPYANIGLILQPGSSGQPRDRTYKGSERGSYGQRVTELGDVLDGFEWTVNSLAGPSGLERHWNWGAPTLGNPAAEHVFGQGAHGGDILDWSIEIDAIKGGTHWEARGDTPQSDASVEAVPLISAVHSSAPHLAAGWPRIDRLIDRPGVIVQQTLEDYAAGWAAKKSGAVRVFSVTVAIGKEPSFTPKDVGDPGRFVMSNEWHRRAGSGPGLNERHRIIGVRVTPVGRDKGKDEMTLIVEEQEAA